MKLFIFISVFVLCSNISAQTLSELIVENNRQDNLISQAYNLTADDETKVLGYRDPYLSFFLSFMVPGFGQFYNRQIGKGAVFLFGIAFSTMILVNLADESSQEDIETTAPLMILDSGLLLVLYVWQLIDAPVSSNKINKENKSRMEVTPVVINKNFGASLKFYF